VLTPEESSEMSFATLAHGIQEKRHLPVSYFHLSRHSQRDVTDHQIQSTAVAQKQKNNHFSHLFCFD